MYVGKKHITGKYLANTKQNEINYGAFLRI